MTLIADALQPHFAPGLIQVTGTSSETLEVLLGRQGAFYPSFNADTSVWEFRFATKAGLRGFFANESARFGCASFQTFGMVVQDLGDIERLPWALVGAYYAAFYAGHAIYRILGRTCTHINHQRASFLRRVLDAYGEDATFNGGLYETWVDGAGGSLSLRGLGDRLGGTHEAFWRLFSVLLEELETLVLKGPLPQLDSQAVFVALAQVRGLLSLRGANASWLSAIRNAIQYRHEMRVWFPSRLSGRRDLSSLEAIARRWSRDPLDIDLPIKGGADLATFLATCTFLVATCRTLLTRIGERGRAGRQRSFAELGPLRYLNLRSL